MNGMYTAIFLICHKVAFVISHKKVKKIIYCDLSGKIFNSLNKFLQDSLLHLPIIILTALFFIVSIFELWVEFPQNMMPPVITT